VQILALRALRRGRYAELLPLASRYAGHSCLYVPARSGWQEAQRIAEAAGGYLVAPSTPAEYGYVSGLIPGRQTGVWLGIRWDGSVNRWESGEPLGWSLLNMSSDIDDPRPKYMINSTLVARPWFTQTADERNGLVIEWDR